MWVIFSNFVALSDNLDFIIKFDFFWELEELWILILTLNGNDKTRRGITSNFVAFSDDRNFKELFNYDRPFLSYVTQKFSPVMMGKDWFFGLNMNRMRALW